LCACFDRIDHEILLKILAQSFQDNRFIRLMNTLLTAGYLENWQYNKTYSGVPAGSIIGPILSNFMLNQLDHYVEKQLIPAYTCGQQRKEYVPYRNLISEINKAKRKKNWSDVKQLRKQLQTTPSYDQQDQDFRRLWYVRYADDCVPRAQRRLP
jgi:retron-type reverse transcriptase